MVQPASRRWFVTPLERGVGHLDRGTGTPGLNRSGTGSAHANNNGALALPPIETDLHSQYQ